MAKNKALLVWSLILMPLILYGVLRHLVVTDDKHNGAYCFLKDKYLSKEEIRQSAMVAWLSSIEGNKIKREYNSDIIDYDRLAASYIESNPKCCGGEDFDQSVLSKPMARRLNLTEHFKISDNNNVRFRGIIFDAPLFNLEENDYLIYSMNSCGKIMVMKENVSGETIYRYLGE